MSRIEEAIMKVKAQAAAQAQSPAQAPAFGQPTAATLATSAPTPLRSAAPAESGAPPSRTAPGDVSVESLLTPRPTRVVDIDLVALRGEGLVPSPDDARRIANEFRAIKRTLLGNITGRSGTKIEGGNIMMTASALPAEGKTFCAFNLALTLSLEKDFSVVLIDGDVVKPNITRVLGLDEQPGLLDVLNSGGNLADVEIGTNIPRLTVVPAGTRDEHASELLSSNRMSRLVESMHAQPNRLFVFDSTPILLTNEARVLSEIAGQVMLVVRAASTPRSAVKSAISQLPEDVYIGVVLNQKPTGVGNEYYSYGDYGRYGQGQE